MTVRLTSSPPSPFICIAWQHVATRVAHFIDATKSHRHVEGDDQLAMFLDADMCVHLFVTSPCTAVVHH